MNSIRLFLFLGIGLSMDTFSLSIIYGTSNMSYKRRLFLSIIVGIFHFIMPFLAYNITRVITHNIINRINTDLITGIILLILSIDMIRNIKKEEEDVLSLSIIGIILFAFTVSIDSFSIGVALNFQNVNIIFAGIIFSICSFIFTLLGLLIGKKISERFSNKINLLGSLILIIISIKYILSSI